MSKAMSKTKPESVTATAEAPASEPAVTSEASASESVLPDAEAERAVAARRAGARMAEIVGQVAALAMTMPSHRHLFLADLEWLVVPAVASGQFRLFRHEGRSIAYASWALVDEEVERRLASGAFKLKPAEWRCGDRLWLMDFIAPPARAQELAETLKKSAFEGMTVKTLRPNPNGQGMIVAEWG